MRSWLWEIAYSVSRGDWPSELSTWNNLTDFNEIRPNQERTDEFGHLRRADYTYWGEIREEEASELLYTDQEANEQSQSMHRYRLFAFANFFTSCESVDDLAEKLGELLADADPGSVLLVMGGEGGDDPGIYEKLRRIAVVAGFGSSRLTRGLHLGFRQSTTTFLRNPLGFLSMRRNSLRTMNQR